MEIHFIRHAEAQHNFDETIFGTEAFYFPHNRFSPLTSVGIQQATELANSISGIKADLVISSSLPRTLMTTQIVFRNTPVTSINSETTLPPEAALIESRKEIPVLVSDLVRETNYHHPCNERRSKSEIRLAYPSFNLDNLTNDKDTVFYSGKDDLNHRRTQLIDWLKQLSRQGQRKIVIVTHQSFLEEILKGSGPISSESVRLRNCEVYTTTLSNLEKIK